MDAMPSLFPKCLPSDWSSFHDDLGLLPEVTDTHTAAELFTDDVPLRFQLKPGPGQHWEQPSHLHEHSGIRNEEEAATTLLLEEISDLPLEDASVLETKRNDTDYENSSWFSQESEKSSELLPASPHYPRLPDKPFTDCPFSTNPHFPLSLDSDQPCQADSRDSSFGGLWEELSEAALPSPCSQADELVQKSVLNQAVYQTHGQSVFAENCHSLRIDKWKKCRKKSRREVDEPRRPQNSFLRFAVRHRREVAQQHPAKDNRSISRLLGARWKQMTAAEKQPYEEEFVRDMEDIKSQNPRWRYAPAHHSTQDLVEPMTHRLRPRHKIRPKQCMLARLNADCSSGEADEKEGGQLPIPYINDAWQQFNGHEEKGGGGSHPPINESTPHINRFWQQFNGQESNGGEGSTPHNVNAWYQFTSGVWSRDTTVSGLGPSWLPMISSVRVPQLSPPLLLQPAVCLPQVKLLVVQTLPPPTS